ncbi:ATP-dependent DNA ligase [Panus rudis PR-1116 ss-1]|nr:ATP-dependent DNA ligase [Panus rudis PR-1116 ss-1]
MDMLPTPAPSSRPATPTQASSPLQPSSPIQPQSQLDFAVPDDSYPEPPPNIGPSPSFSVLTRLFDKLSTERKPEKRRKLLDAWFNRWRDRVGHDLYPALRLILPQKDRERAVYGLKEKNLAKIYIKLIPLRPKDPDAVRLLNWKRPTDRYKTSGDFPQVLLEVVKQRSSVTSTTLTVQDVNDILDQLAANMGKSDIQARIMQKVYNKMRAEDQRWIVRIILKDMTISVKETTVFSVFHPDAHDLFNTCSDLKKIAWELWDPMRRLNSEDKEVQLFRAFAPMLCKRPTRKIEDSVKEMGGRAFIMEEKLDGERIQLHKRGNEYFYCSRKGKDYTYLYGKHVGEGSLTPYIDQAFDPRIESIILDGEMLVWDPVSERNMPFGTLKTAALEKERAEYSPRPCFKVFDLLSLNGVSLLHKSLKYRKRNLRHCIEEVKGRLEFISETEGKTAQDVRKRMDEIMENRGEGLVMKHPDSEYILNGRNKDWIKVKPEYMDNMGETVDVLVVGGNYGTGRRSGGVSTLICAVRDDKGDDDDDEPKYSTFVRIGTGLSFSDYVWVRKKPWKTWDSNNPPSWLRVSPKGNEDKGDIYLEPEDSFILKVKAAEITSSDQYHMGFTMRFPRALSIRDDLSADACMTSTGVLEMIRSGKKRKMEDTDDKKKKRKTTKKKPAIMAEYQGVDLRNMEVSSKLFKGYTFVVSSDPKSKTGEEDKRELMTLIKKHGGKLVQIARSQLDLLVVYGGKTIAYDIRQVMNKGIHDIIKPDWITESIAKGELLPLTKKYFFHATETRKASDEYDADDEDDDEAEDDSKMDDEPKSPVASGSKFREPATPTQGTYNDEVSQAQAAVEAEVDPAVADWFKVDHSDLEERSEHAEPAPDSDSETEPEADSDNEDTRDEDGDMFAEKEDEDWENVTLPPDSTDEKSDGSATEDEEQPESKEVKMGEDDAVMEYDEAYIFKHLCFYLDTPENARKNGMAIQSKHESKITEDLARISGLITDNGGKIVDLDDPKLTHVVLDKRDLSRRVELMRRTSKPKRRHLVHSGYIEACLEEESLLDEDAFTP